MLTEKRFRYYARVVKDRAWASLARFYPLGPGGEEIFAWRWTWAVPSPNPAASGAVTPLVTDWSLSKSRREKTWVIPHINGQDIVYSIATVGKILDPTSGRNSARCLFTGAPMTFDYLRAQAKRGRL